MNALIQSGVTLHRNNVRWLVIHRISLSEKAPGNPNPIRDEDLTGEELIRRFRNAGLGTGGRCPYHVLIRHDARVEQLLPLTVKGAHAPNYNWRSLGVAVAGRTDLFPILPEQWVQLVKVCIGLIGYWPDGLAIAGHTDLPGASDDPTKQCPGQYLIPRRLETRVLGWMPNGWGDWDEDQCLEWVRLHGWEI
jgi:hypothetical protein